MTRQIEIDDEKELEIEGDQDDLPEEDYADFSSKNQRIRTKSVDPEIESLHGKWQRGKLAGC